MRIKFDKGENLTVAIFGTFISADTKIIPIDLTGKHPAESKIGDPFNLASALNSATSKPKPEEAVEPGGNGPLLKWQVASEEQLHGYLVYRATSEKGNYAIVSKEAIPVVRENLPSSNVYSWRDTSAQAGETYWYYVADILLDGRLQQLTGPQKVVAK